jgi:hypothetical protein
VQVSRLRLPVLKAFKKPSCQNEDTRKPETRQPSRNKTQNPQNFNMKLVRKLLQAPSENLQSVSRALLWTKKT